MCDGTAGTPDLRDRFIKGWAAGVDPGGTGGAATHTHTTGTYAASADSAGTPAGTNSVPTFAGSALAAHTHGVGTYAASAHSGAAVDDHASHTHTYTQVVNHTHVVDVTDPGHMHVENNNSATTGGLAGWGARDTSTNTSAATGYSTASAVTGITAATQNPAGGVATGTTAGPSAILTHAVTQPAAHTLSGSSSADSAGTPAGTVSAPTFTGSTLGTHSHTLSGSSDTVNHEPTYFKLAFIMKT